MEAGGGGGAGLPHAANSLRFASARSVEVAAMWERVARPSKSKLAFQTLPVHMRRRVMSHHARRLPRGLRARHLDQLRRSGLPPARRRPTRAFRRRPRRLQQEYARRQRARRWLEAHVWHARRFRMTERWGWRLPEAPCDKAFRACYRAASAHCLLRDVSYLECVRLDGSEDDIRSGFADLTGLACGLGVSARAYSAGDREGSIHVFRPGEYPYGYVGKVHFIWKPNERSVDRTLWIFVHPAFYKEFLEIVKSVFEPEANALDENQDSVPEKRFKSDDRVKLTQMKHQLNRFSLTGPLSHSVLIRSLKVIKDVETLKSDSWVQEYVDSNRNEKLKLKEKWCYWDSIQNITSPGELPPRMVVGLVVKDPRLTQPAKRTKAQPDTYNPVPVDILINIPDYISQSPLWDQNVQDKVLEKRWTDGQLIKYATRHQLIPGEVHENNPDVQSVPIILIQMPGSQNEKVKRLGYGSGWDIIIPAGYSLAFWRTFIMFGARAGGLRETENLARESFQCCFPPDCDAARIEEDRRYTIMRERYFRLPPNKRVNYIKLGINSPFKCHWKLLLSEWGNITDKFYVVRSISELRMLRDCMERLTSPIHHEMAALVPVYIQIKGKGPLERNATICIPKECDRSKKNGFFEPCHEDPNEKLRKEMRKEHKAMLKKLRRKRVNKKKSGAKNSKLKPKVKTPQTSEYTAKMRQLWLPTNIDKIRNYASREVMGYVTEGAFSFTEACSCGIGYITYNSLIYLISHNFRYCLVRNTNSRHYMFASINVV